MTWQGDSFTKAGAKRIGWEIENVWKRLGHTNVRAWVEELGDAHDHAEDRAMNRCYVTRSNLVNGLPPNALVKPTHRIVA